MIQNPQICEMRPEETLWRIFFCAITPPIKDTTMPKLGPAQAATGRDPRSSAAHDVSVGSGSRPTASKITIETSAPKDAHGLDGRSNTPNKPLK